MAIGSWSTDCGLAACPRTMPGSMSGARRSPLPPSSASGLATIPERWDEFAERYRTELCDHEDLVTALVERTEDGRVTLVYGAKDTEHNQAVVLAQVLEDRRLATA
jgi:hypothetical protein